MLVTKQQLTINKGVSVKNQKIEIRIGVCGKMKGELAGKLGLGDERFSVTTIGLPEKKHAARISATKQFCHFLIFLGKRGVTIARLDYTPSRKRGKKDGRVDETLIRRNGRHNGEMSAHAVRDTIGFMLKNLGRAGRASWLGRVG